MFRPITLVGNPQGTLNPIVGGGYAGEAMPATLRVTSRPAVEPNETGFRGYNPVNAAAFSLNSAPDLM